MEEADRRPGRDLGHLIAYMPHIQRRIDREGARLFVLPRPSLQASNVLKASGELGRLATEQGRATAEVRQEALASLREELEARGLHRPSTLLES